MASIEDLCATFEKDTFSTKAGDHRKHIMETFLLDGKYTIKMDYLNEVASAMYDKNVKYDDNYFKDVESCKAVYFCGNVLYKPDEPKIWDYINLIITATFTKKLPVKVDRNVRNRNQMMGGTICPTRDVIFAYDDKLFVLYGRYIYGYDQSFVRFVNENPKNIKEDDEDDDYDQEEELEEDVTLPPSLSNNEIILPVVPYDTNTKLKDWLYDYNYSFAILDIPTNVLIAFALYR